MKIPRIKRDVALLFSICSLAIIPLLVVGRSRSNIGDDKSIVNDDNGIAADISPDGKFIAMLEPSSRYREFTENQFTYVGLDLVVRQLGDGKKSGEDEIKVRAWAGHEYRSVRWSKDGKSISTWGKRATLYDFAGGATSSTETWAGNGGSSFSRTVLPLRSMAETKDAYAIGPAWVLPESDYMMGRDRTGMWAATEISTQRDIPLKMPLGNPAVRIASIFQTFAGRPLAASLDNSATNSIQIAEVRAEPTPTPTPYPTPTAKQILQSKEITRKEAYAAALNNQLAQIQAQLNVEDAVDEEQQAKLEVRASEINKELADYAPYNYGTPDSPNFPSLPLTAPIHDPMPVITSSPPVYANVNLKDVIGGRMLWTHRIRYLNEVSVPAWSNDGSLLALIGKYNKQAKEGNIKILDGKNGLTISEYTLPSEQIGGHARFFRSSKGTWSLMVPSYNYADSAFRFLDVPTGRLMALWSFAEIRKLNLSPEFWACNQSGEVWAFASADPKLRNEKYRTRELKWVKMTRKQLDKRLGTSGPKS